MASGTIILDSDIGTFAGKIEWSSSSNGSNANTSQVIAKLYISKNNNYTTTGTFSYGFNVGGQTVYGSWYGSISGEWIEIATIINYNVAHNNDGTGQCYIEAYVFGPSGTTLDGHSVSGSESVTLDTIPRYAKITNFAVKSTGLNSISIDWSADSAIDWLQYRVNGGAWKNASGNPFSIGNLNPNTTYSIKIQVRRTDSGLWTESGEISGKTKDIAHISRLAPFNFGDDMKISILNQSGKTVKLELSINNTIIKSQIIVSGENIIQFSQSELDNIYKKFPMRNSIYFECRIITDNQYPEALDNECILTGKVKTFRLFKNQQRKRCMVYIGGQNGIVKRGVTWVNYNGAIKRGM